MRPSWHIGAAAAIAASVVLIAGCGEGGGPTSAAPAETPVSRQAARRGQHLVPLTIHNGTSEPITLKVFNTDNFDWNGNRPDHPSPEGFQGTVLTKGEGATRGLVTNQNSNPFFEIAFIIGSDPNPPSVRLQQKSRYEPMRATTSPAPQTSTGRGQPGWDIYPGWGSSDTNEVDCRPVTKSFPEDGIKVTIECQLPNGQSLIEIENL